MYTAKMRKNLCRRVFHASSLGSMQWSWQIKLQ